MSDLLRQALALHLLPSIGPGTFSKLWQHWPSYVSIFSASEKDLAKILSQEALSLFNQFKLAKGDLASQVEKELALCEQHDIEVVHMEHKHYPALLKQSPCPPSLLYIRGNVEALSLPQIAIVGARKASPTACELAAEFAAQLASSGFVVTSGLALGIDGQAHQGALYAASKPSGLAQGAATIAVLGSGLLSIYPQRHRLLAENIVQQGGALVSELALTKKAMSYHFPQRNRIIVGLSVATLVIEAALKSGSLISARLALEQDREVFAVPGSVRNENSRGCHALIKQGAALVESAQDVIDALAHWQAWFQQQLF